MQPEGLQEKKKALRISPQGENMECGDLSPLSYGLTCQDGLTSQDSSTLSNWFDKSNQMKAVTSHSTPEMKSLAATYSPTLLCAVPSAMKGLTSEFGMGSGISPSPLPPSKIVK